MVAWPRARRHAAALHDRPSIGQVCDAGATHDVAGHALDVRSC
jgi:hypothetical protein